MQAPKADFGMCSGWGRRISWTDSSQFQKRKLDEDEFDVNGHHDPVPVVGQTLVAEFQRSWIVFEFVSVERMSDPEDQFFAKVKAVKQVLKDAS